MDDRARLFNALNKLTERNEKLLADHNKLKKKFEEQHSTQSAIGAALEKQNALLRKRVEDREDEITELERKLALWESGEHGADYFRLFLTVI